MSKEKDCLKEINRLYKASYMDAAMFNFIEGIRFVLPNFSVDDCLKKFAMKYDLSEDEYNLDSARVTYHRMKKIFLNQQ